ncbi:hypothetical protein Gotri_010697 [Gossypium trilobum]|uniref:Methyltransferase type 11 domain-containing protein n=1 Tax=Gossypium trilobum TaxID=34281 RepID=A0A7J9ER76_9ROSI|nr:hypothetical protein [Gossypium trilobum]
MALSKMGLKNVIGVELIESLPLVSRVNPHNLPLFDRAFDVDFTGHLMAALYPLRNAEEIERTVRKGGVCVVVVDECGEEEVNEIDRLFRRAKAWVVEHNICRLQRKQIQLPNGLGGAARTEHSAPYNSPAAV